MNMATFTEDQIRNAVMGYSEGCTDGKVTFLQDAFDIVASCEQTVELRMTLTVPAYDSGGERISASDIAANVESCLDSELCHYVEGDNTECVDTRVSTL
jgi:hypothetical protein